MSNMLSLRGGFDNFLKFSTVASFLPDTVRVPENVSGDPPLARRFVTSGAILMGFKPRLFLIFGIKS